MTDQTSMAVAERPQCDGLKRDGTRCTRLAFAAGETQCRQHAGLAAGRPPTGITSEQAADLFEKLRTGVPRERALIAVGISRRTFYNWLEKADEPEASGDYRAFAAGIAQAEARFEVDLVEVLHKKAMDGDASAAKFLLERRAPDSFGNPGVRGGGRGAGQIKLPVDGTAGAEADSGADDNVIPIRPPRPAADSAGADW